MLKQNHHVAPSVQASALEHVARVAPMTARVNVEDALETAPVVVR